MKRGMGIQVNVVDTMGKADPSSTRRYVVVDSLQWPNSISI